MLRLPSQFDPAGHAMEPSADEMRRRKELGPPLGRRLRIAREAAGLTTRELAALAHTSKKTIQDLSDGKGGNSGIGLIADIARGLGVSPAWLAYGEGQGPEEEE